MKITFKRKVLLVAIISLLFIPLLANTGRGDNSVSESILTPENPPSTLQLGRSIAVSGDSIVVGAPSRKSASAYVFTHDGNTWDEGYQLPAPPSPALYFGWDVAISGDTLIVAAFDFITLDGSAHLYRYDGAKWIHESELISGPGVGVSVAIDGNVAVVGAIDFSSRGSAYVFVYDEENLTWRKEAELTAQTSFPPFFGWDVAIDSNTAVIGAPSFFDPQEGTAHVFNRNIANGTWTENDTSLSTNSPVSETYFGGSVAIDGNTVVVGAPPFLYPYMASYDRLGSAYVFRLKPDNSWEEESLPLPAANGFGNSVDISTNTVVVGVPLDDDLNKAEEGINVGAAYVFRYVGGSWVALEKSLRASDGEQTDQFGWSVAIDGDRVAVGAPFWDYLDLDDSGAAYAFMLPSPKEDGPLVEILSVSTGKEYSLGTAEVGAYPYIDRHYKIERMSHRLVRSVLVATANDDKWVSAYDHLQLQLNRSAELFVCYDKRGAWRRPSWLVENGWVRTNEYIATSDWPASPLEVYKKFIEVDGGPVIETLGGNHYGRDTRARSNYFVLVKEPQEDIVTIESVSSDRPYSLAAAIKGARPYIDRPYRIKAIGAALNGGVLVCTANNDKRLRVEEHLDLRINKDAEVFVLYDKRGAAHPPDWLEDGWERTHDYIKTSYWPSSPMKVFKRFVEVGDTPEIITLGGNRSGGGKRARSNYFVIVKEPKERTLDIVRVSTGKPYSFSTAEIFSRPYIDRGYKITEMSSELEGGMLLQTANNDKWVSEPKHLILDSTSPADIYVCYDRRGSEHLPGWLDNPNWTLTDFSVKTTDRPASPLVVLKTKVDAGEITLGGNHSGGDTGARSNYFVIIKQ